MTWLNCLQILFVSIRFITFIFLSQNCISRGILSSLLQLGFFVQKVNVLMICPLLWIESGNSGVKLQVVFKERPLVGLAGGLLPQFPVQITGLSHTVVSKVPLSTFKGPRSVAPGNRAVAVPVFSDVHNWAVVDGIVQKTLLRLLKHLNLLQILRLLRRAQNLRGTQIIYCVVQILVDLFPGEILIFILATRRSVINSPFQKLILLNLIGSGS